jgi:uncharacterized protein YceH (UPF0502 family)
VLALDEVTVQQTLDELIKKRLVLDKSGFGSRVVKYQHRFCNSEFGTLKFSLQELGIVCVLLLRGPQTAGELRTRTNRLCKFSDVHEVETTLAQLMGRDDGPFVVRLPHEAGKRESRYAHLFSGEVQIADSSQHTDARLQPCRGDNERFDQLQRLVSELRQELQQLEDRIGQLESRGASE